MKFQIQRNSNRFFLAMLPVFLVASSAFGISSFPVKSHVCMAVFGQVVAQPKRQGTEVYVLNSLSAIRNSIQPNSDLPSTNWKGFYSSHSANSTKKMQFASRLKGIEDFSSVSVNTESGTKNSLNIISLRGTQEITEFIDRIRKEEEYISGVFKKDVFEKFKIITGVNLFLLFSFNPSAINLENPMLVPGLLALVATQFLWKQDFLHQRPLYWDYSFSRNLRDIERFSYYNEGDFVLAISRNFDLASRTRDSIKYGEGEEGFAETLLSQSYQEALPLRDRITAPMLDLQYKPQWVGVDMVLEVKKGQEPELHVVVRNSENMPIYPKTSKVKDVDRETSLAPGLVPIRIDGK